MKRRFDLFSKFAVIALTAVAVAGLSTSAFAQKREINIKKASYNPDHRTIELFEGMESGELEAKIILKDSTEGKVFITNKSGEPVNVKLPGAFVAIHAQLQPPGGAGGLGQGQGGFGQGGGGQAGGGGFGNPGGGFGGGGGLFNIPPERVGEIAVPCVCLEHGKKEPNSRMTYVLKPVDEFSDNPMLPEVLSLLARGEFPQPAAQAVAWHLTDGMSWDELVAKRIDNLNGTFTQYFSAQEMVAAQQLYLTAKKMADEHAAETKTSDSFADRLRGDGN